MNITIIGGGNVGTLLAGVFTKKGHIVTIYTRDTKLWSKEITVLDKDTDLEYKFTPYKITNNVKEAVENAQIIFITLPASVCKDFILQSEEYIKPKTWVGFYPGTGGIEFISKNLIEKGCIIFGTQRICSIARLKEYGKYVVTSGKRKELFLGVIPHNKTEEISKKVSELLDIKITPLPNYLNVTLTSSNPILHPTRLYSIFKDYQEGYTYEKIPLLKHYESKDTKTLTNKIRSIKSFKGIKTPYIEIENRYIPDLSNRYFTADFPYGLVIIKAFAMICNIKTPNIDLIISWYQSIIKKEYINLENNTLGIDSKELSIPQLYGINTLKDIEKYYNKR